MLHKNFICKVVNELLEDDFSINISQVKNINGYGGWFDSDKKEFTVAIKNSCGFEILIHEYSHYLQWKNKKRFFNKLMASNIILFDWLGGVDTKDKVLDHAISDVIELEWDCECQSIELIKQFKLEVNIDDYCRAANAYLMYYHMVHQHRKWVDAKSPSPYNPRILKLMESSLQPLDYYMNKDNITEAQEREYLKVLK